MYDLIKELVGNITIVVPLSSSYFLISQDAMKALHSDLLHLFRNCQDLVKFGSGRGQRAAYVTFADLLMVFAKQLRKLPHLASLVYIPDANLQRTLQVPFTAKYAQISAL